MGAPFPSGGVRGELRPDTAPQARVPGRLVREPVLRRAAVAAALRRSASAEGPAPFSVEELRTLVLEGGKYLPPKHQKILLNLFDLRVDNSR